MITTVACIFRASRRGLGELMFAYDIARRLRVPLDVYAATVSVGVAYPDFQATQAKRIRELLPAVSEIKITVRDYALQSQGDTLDLTAETLLVSNTISQTNASVVVPKNELSLAGHGLGSILVPLGNGESGRYVLEHGLKAVRQLGNQIVLYHTTYRNPTIKDPDLRLHMCEEARQLIGYGEFLARQHELSASRVIEAADSVVAGIVQAAIINCCSLIVMARGTDTTRGSYVDRLLQESMIPVLIIGREKARAVGGLSCALYV